MRVLVTGATGFVGSHLAELLARNGQSVRTLARPTSDTRFLESIGVEIVRGDLADQRAVKDAVDGCERVYHLAGITSTARESHHLLHTVNVVGTENLARAASAVKVQRFVHVSTCGVYGRPKQLPVTEVTPINPNSAYRTSKVRSEQVVLAEREKAGLPVVIARISSVYGPRSRNWLGMFRAVQRTNFRIIGSGANRMHMGYADDIAAGLRCCGEVSGIEGRVYNLAGTKPETLHTFLTLIAKELDVNLSLRHAPALPFELFYRVGSAIYRATGRELPRFHRYEVFLLEREFDLSKARRELGYDPKVSLAEGVRNTVAAYRAAGLLGENSSSVQ